MSWLLREKDSALIIWATHIAIILLSMLRIKIEGTVVIPVLLLPKPFLWTSKLEELTNNWIPITRICILIRPTHKIKHFTKVPKTLNNFQKGPNNLLTSNLSLKSVQQTKLHLKVWISKLNASTQQIVLWHSQVLLFSSTKTYKGFKVHRV